MSLLSMTFTVNSLSSLFLKPLSLHVYISFLNLICAPMRVQFISDHFGLKGSDLVSLQYYKCNSTLFSFIVLIGDFAPTQRQTVSELGARRSDIQDRYRFDTGRVCTGDTSKLLLSIGCLLDHRFPTGGSRPTRGPQRALWGVASHILKSVERWALRRTIILH